MAKPRAPASAPQLHPKLAEFYRQKVAKLQHAYIDTATQSEANEILDQVCLRAAARRIGTNPYLNVNGQLALRIKDSRM